MTHLTQDLVVFQRLNSKLTSAREEGDRPYTNTYHHDARHPLDLRRSVSSAEYTRNKLGMTRA